MTDYFFVGSVNTQVGTIALLRNLEAPSLQRVENEVFETSMNCGIACSLLDRYLL